MSNTRSLLESAFHGNLDRLKKLVAELDDGNDIAKKIGGIRDTCGMSPLHLSIMNGKLEVVKYLIDELKLDVDLKENNAGHTAINCAVRGGFYEIAVYLLEKGANPNIPSDTGVTALHWAEEKG
ncbi:hypothetical protein ACHQM5_013303 [Ranunculus cassubicifolius]